MEESIVGNDSSATILNETIMENSLNEEPLIVFRVEDMKTLETKSEFNLEDYYIKNKESGTNHYYIDENQTLWGYGYNNYGQLGIGKIDDIDTYYTDPVKIAENVITVDFSCNGYFCVYLTTDGKLYGMGSNMFGLLGQEYKASRDYDTYVIVDEPVLLMENVTYVRAGIEAIVALDNTGNVWWWGQYRTTDSTLHWDNAFEMYWKAKEDEKNPVKMLSNSPKMVLQNCIYATTGDMTGAAIGQNGELYTWGLNIFGECGTEVINGDFVRTPKKVLENVRMVWPEKIAFDSMELEIPETRYDTTYRFNVFVLLKDGTILCAGKGLGTKVKQIGVTGDLEYTTSSVYSDAFVPIGLEKYSEEENRIKLNELKWGMSVEETEKILTREGLRYESIMPDYRDYIVVENSKYVLFFDESLQLSSILLQVGGSRNLKFTMGMSMEEVQALLDCDLICDDDLDGDNPIYWSQKSVDDSFFRFTFFENTLNTVWEMRSKQ